MARLPRIDQREAARRCLKPAAWPVADQAAWAAANAAVDVLDAGGQAARWSVPMRRSATQAYGRWLTWLTLNDRLDAARPLAERATPEAILAYVAHLKGAIGSVTVATYLHHLHRALEVMTVDGDWAWLRRIANRLRRRATPRDKRDRIVRSSELFDLGRDLMRQAEAGKGSPLGRAGLFRDGLLIALLAARPMRMANLASIQIGRHLVHAGGAHWLLFTAAETKQRRRLEFTVPDALAPQLERYLAVHRPALLTPRKRQDKDAAAPLESAYLWISREHSQWSDGTIHHSVVKHTQARFGFEVNPHLFRNCAATSIAIEDPDNIAMVMAILGHGSLAISERHYIAANSMRAMRTYHAHIQGIRRQTHRDRRRAGKATPPASGRRGDWNDPPPGFMEADLVAHSGPTSRGSSEAAGPF